MRNYLGMPIVDPNELGHFSFRGIFGNCKFNYALHIKNAISPKLQTFPLVLHIQLRITNYELRIKTAIFPKLQTVSLVLHIQFRIPHSELRIKTAILP